MTTATYLVKGMSCDHCAHAVSSEVGAIPGVEDVQVDLVSGQVTVRSAAPLELAAVSDAVAEAGYQLVPG